VPLEAKGMFDLIVHYIDSNGNIIWKHRYGGTNNDATSGLSSVDPLTKDLYFINRTESSVSGDITYASGSCWILKIDTLGNIKGSKSYGAATNTTWMDDAIWHEHKLWVFAHSTGGGGDMEPSSPISNINGWIAVIDSNTNLVAKYTLNTIHTDYFSDGFLYKNNLYISGFISTDTVHHFGCNDSIKSMGFILKPSLSPLGIIQPITIEKNIFDLYPNPTSKILSIRFSTYYNGYHAELKVFKTEGSIVYNKKIKEIGKEEQIDCCNWETGTYMVQITINNRITSTKQFIKK
jgi:hypothetical protein